MSRKAKKEQRDMYSDMPIDKEIKEVIEKTREFPYDIEEEEQADVYYDDYVEDKPLSELISDIKELLNKYRNKLSVETVEENGSMSEVIITARIQIK